MTIAIVAFLLLVAIALAFRGHGYWAWVVPGVAALGLWGGTLTPITFGVIAILFGSVALIFGLPAVRRRLVSRMVMRKIGPMLPVLGDTERIALEAGTVWWDRDLFSGAPNWKTLLSFTPQSLSASEQAFLEGPVEELCAMLDRQTITQLGDLPSDIWSFLKSERFFGLIIPESFGGLGFSAAAHSADGDLGGPGIPLTASTPTPRSAAPNEARPTLITRGPFSSRDRPVTKRLRDPPARSPCRPE